jgi:hypothetical protein
MATPAPFPAGCPARDDLLEVIMAVSLGLGADFEAEVADLAGITGFDPGSLSIDFLNPTGETTVRLTVAVNVDTPSLKAIIAKYTS